jgi:hypothetical protein
MAKKTLNNTTSDQVKDRVRDVKLWGDGDLFKLLSKTSSKSEGWMKSTKAMEVNDVGCVVQVTTQQRNPDGSYSLAEAVTFVPGVRIREYVVHPNVDKVVSRRLESLD